MYAAMGLGVLAKGPVGLVLPTAVIGMYLLIATLPPVSGDGRRGTRWLGVLRPFAPFHFLRTCWTMRPISALAASLAVASPWYVWVTVRTDGEWTRGFFLQHNVARALQTMEGHAGPPILFYAGAILVGFFPWSILAIPTGVVHGRSRCRLQLSPAPARRYFSAVLDWRLRHAVLAGADKIA